MTTPDPRLDRVLGLSRELVTRAGAVALETNDQIDKGAFDFATWAKSMQKLFDLGLAGALSLAPDMLTPCLPVFSTSSDDSEHSEYVEVNPDNQYIRKISVVPGSFTHDGVPNFKIPDHLIYFDPPQLKPLATQLQICVIWPGLRSGTYRGKIRLVPDGGVGATSEYAVIIDL
jgi:hypothetical protein